MTRKARIKAGSHKCGEMVQIKESPFLFKGRPASELSREELLQIIIDHQHMMAEQDRRHIHEINVIAGLVLV